MKDNERLVRIEQKLTDFIETHKVKHRELEEQVGRLTKIKNKIETPVKWVGWFVTLSTGGALAYMGEHAAHWLLKHFSGGS